MTSTPRVPKFLRSLYTILQQEDPAILCWSNDGTHFQIHDVDRLETQVLPRYFKHNKFASFQRQLNNFGFRKWTKTRARVCTFSHDTLVRCTPTELPVMMLRVDKKYVAPFANDASSSSTGKRRRAEEDQNKGVSDCKQAKHEPLDSALLELLPECLDDASLLFENVEDELSVGMLAPFLDTSSDSATDIEEWLSAAEGSDADDLFGLIDPSTEPVLTPTTELDETEWTALANYLS